MLAEDLLAALTAFDSPVPGIVVDSVTSAYIPAPDLQAPAKECRPAAPHLRLVPALPVGEFAAGWLKTSTGLKGLDRDDASTADADNARARR